MLEQLVGRLDGMQADITGSISALAGRMDAGEHAVADLTAQMRGARAQHQSPSQHEDDVQPDAPPAPARVLFEADVANDDPPAPAQAPAPAAAPAAALRRSLLGTSSDSLPAAPAEEEDEGDDEELAEQLWDSLGGGLDASARPTLAHELGDAFAGHPLPLRHVTGDGEGETKSNPFPRDRNFRDRTCHYHPSNVGDSQMGTLTEKLLTRSNTSGFEVQGVYSFELRSMTCALS